MRFGVRLPNSGPFASPSALLAIAQGAEALGYEAVLVHDHVHWGEEDKYHFYAGSAEAADQSEHPRDFYDPLLACAYLAGHTTRLRFLTSAIVLAWRHPVLLARQVSSLYALCGGRLILGVTVGNLPRDFAAMNSPWEERGRRGTEHLRALRTALGLEGSPSFAGEYVRFEQVAIEPPPAGLRLWYCGTSDLALRRAVRFTSGWMPDAPPRYFREMAAKVQQELARAGRSPADFEIASVCTVSIAPQESEARAVAERLLTIRSQESWFKAHQMRDAFENALIGTPEQVRQRVGEYAAAGVSFLGLGFVAHTLADMKDQMRLFAEEVFS